VTRKKCEPPGLPIPTAQDSETHGNHTSRADTEQLKFIPAPRCELRPVALGWRDPAELLCVADATGLDVLDFWDKVCRVTTGFLRLCAERGEAPTIDGAVEFLRQRQRPVDPIELQHLIDTQVPLGDMIACLTADVLRESQERAEADARYATQCGWRELADLAFACPNWSDELREFRRWKRRMKRNVERDFKACQLREAVWHV